MGQMNRKRAACAICSVVNSSPMLSPSHHGSVVSVNQPSYKLITNFILYVKTKEISKSVKAGKFHGHTV